MGKLFTRRCHAAPTVQQLRPHQPVPAPTDLVWAERNKRQDEAVTRKMAESGREEGPGWREKEEQNFQERDTWRLEQAGAEVSDMAARRCRPATSIPSPVQIEAEVMTRSLEDAVTELTDGAEATIVHPTCARPGEGRPVPSDAPLAHRRGRPAAAAAGRRPAAADRTPRLHTPRCLG